MKWSSSVVICFWPAWQTEKLMIQVPVLTKYWPHLFVLILRRMWIGRFLVFEFCEWEWVVMLGGDEMLIQLSWFTVLCLVIQSCPSPGDLPNSGIKPRSPTLQVDSLPSEPPERSKNTRVGAYPFSSGSSWPRNLLGSPALQADSLPAELPGKPWFTR